MLIVNASFTAGEFYRITINGLCENTSYEFSSWMINLLPTAGCGGAGIPINVKFEIWDNTDTNILASGNTGNINGSSSPDWQQYALVFQTAPGQTSAILKMTNNGVGGCGNDLAIDDIVFKSCGDSIAIEDTMSMTEEVLCENELPYTTTLTTIPDFSIFSSHFYQWQTSSDGINWVDIAGETNNTYTTPLLNNTTQYRVKVAEDAVNVNNDFCNAVSEVFKIRVIPFPDAPVSNGDLLICENDTTPLRVIVPPGNTVNWYDAAVGGNLLLAGNTTFNPNNAGIYYAEAETINNGCLSTTRTALEIKFFETPQVQDEMLEFCENTMITLHADTNISTATYLWNTGDVTEEITVSSPGTYTVDVSNENCVVTKTIELIQIDNPVIENVTSDGNDIIVPTTNSGDFLYSIDGNIFQPGNTFFNIDGGLYTIYVKARDCDEIITTQHLHFYIPKFFTPNNDGKHDEFDLKGIEYFSSSFVSIFDRYGKLLKSSRNTAFSWNGTFNNQLLPTDDYWYIIVVDNEKFTGHFTLKR